MIKYSKSIIYIIFLSFIYLLVYSCAQVGNISGGDKDTVPPVLLYSEPPMADTGFTGKRIKITFDEYFTIEDINQEFIASPPLNEFPDIRWKKHSLIIDISDTLKKPETYTLYFGNAIQDLNEKNILENFKFIFSTGSVIDSFAISGRLRNAKDLKVPENTLVFAYRAAGDSVPFLSKPDYLSKIDTSGNFSISNIQGGTYKIFAIKDLNGDLLLNPMEERAFLDSLIIPQREIIVNIDSLKAGTILHDLNDTTYADTLQRDTVIITEQHFTYPNNIYLYLFPEINKKQRFAEYLRPKPAIVSLSFDIPLNEKYQMRPLNFHLSDSNYLFEINPQKDSIIYWFRDTTIQNIDTLLFEITFETIDSLNNPILQTDTILAEFRAKKDDNAWKKNKNKDTSSIKPIEYLNLSFDLEKNKLDLKKNLSFEVSEPIFNIDSNKIKLFEIIDTNTIDTKEQKIIRALRISEKNIFIQFRRPIIHKIQLSILNKKQKQNWYKKTRQADSSSFYFELNDEELIKTDTLKLIVDFDNNFFLEQIQELSDTIQLALTRQKLKYKNRPKDNFIELAFNKPMQNKIKVFVLNYQEKTNALRLQQNLLKDSLRIFIRNNELRRKDTLKLSLKSLDYINSKGDSIFYTDTLTMVYHEKKQFLSYIERPKPETVKLVYNKAIDNIDIKPLNFEETKWYNLKYNTTRDSLEISIFNPSISNLDTLNLLLKYTDKNRHGKITEFADSILLIKNKQLELQKKEINQTKKKEAKPQIVHIYFPIDYQLNKDSALLRVYHISSKWKADTKYRLKIDSMAFTGFLNHYNQNLEQDFSSQKEDYYALLNINIKNIKPDFSSSMQDTNSTDSTGSDTIIKSKTIVYSNFFKQRVKNAIGSGTIIIQLVKIIKEKDDEKEEIVKEYFLNKNKSIKIDYINPGTYRLKVIFDRNANNKWDTGNYLKHLFPEKVLYYPKKFEMKEGWEMNLDWDIGKSLIKSLKNGD